MFRFFFFTFPGRSGVLVAASPANKTQSEKTNKKKRELLYGRVCPSQQKGIHAASEGNVCYRYIRESRHAAAAAAEGENQPKTHKTARGDGWGRVWGVYNSRIPPLEQTVIHGLFTGWTCMAEALQKS